MVGGGEERKEKTNKREGDAGERLRKRINTLGKKQARSIEKKTGGNYEEGQKTASYKKKRVGRLETVEREGRNEVARSGGGKKGKKLGKLNEGESYGREQGGFSRRKGQNRGGWKKKKKIEGIQNHWKRTKSEHRKGKNK